MTKHKSIENAINAKSFAILLGSEYDQVNDSSVFYLSIRDKSYTMLVEYHSDGAMLLIVNDVYIGVCNNVKDLLSWMYRRNLV